jgi:transglutaminase-like putative cysteine protease
MAHPTGTTARVQRLTALVAIVLVAVAVGFAFGRVFVGHGATYRLLAVGVASAVVAWAFERRSLLLATLVSAALLVVAIGLLVFPETTWFGAPTLETLRQVGHAAAQVGEEARIQVSPAPPNPSLMLAAITAVWAAVFSCFALAFRAGSPLLSLVPPVALVAFADSVLDGIIKPVYGVLFLIAALAVVFADSLRRIHGWGPVWSPPGSRNRLLPSAGRGARRVGAGAVVLAALAPFIIPGFGSKAVIDLSSLNSDNRVHVSPLVEIGAKLNLGDPVEVFQVTSDHPAYWRMVGLDQMDANGAWNQNVEAGVPIQPQQPLPGQDAIDATEGVTIDANFTIKSDLAFTTLPIAYQPSELLSSEDSVTWFSRSKTMSVAEWPDAGSTYSVRSIYPTPSAQQLRDTPIGTPVEYPADVELPSEIPPQIEELAKEWTNGETNPFDQIMAIQNHFHGFGFQYDTKVTYPATLQSLVDFLTVDKVGFCEQYASAMAAMLRTLHIPARIATGFTPGEGVSDNTNTYSVATTDLHAWVEVPFKGYGWLPFEPTPGPMVNPAMTSYMLTSVGTCQERNCSNPNPNDPTNQSPGQQTKKESKACLDKDPLTICKNPDSNDAGGGAPLGTLERGPLTDTAPPPPARITPGALVFWLGLVAALVLAGIPLVRWVRRRRRIRQAAREPRSLILATYDVFSERAGDLGLGRGAGETPGEYRRRIEATDLLTDGHMERLTGTVVRAAYSARPVTHDDALDASADADQVIRDLRRATPLRRRIFGVYRRD